MKEVRALFVSDLHLGYRHSRGALFAELLENCRPEFLYLAGDILDGKRLAAKWNWPDSCQRIVDRVLQLAANGTRIFYTPGNHDAFLRRACPAVRGIDIADEFVHTTAAGKRLLVVHGDLFEPPGKVPGRIGRLASRLYDTMTGVNRVTSRISRPLGLGEFNYSYAIKRLSKQVLGTSIVLPRRIAGHAVKQGFDGVVYGHLHRPSFERRNGVWLCNCGDWVEHRSFVAEWPDGALELQNAGRTLARISAHKFE
jgi:UDP-2,3-diacylglucosamine pyrophosphatase LpxH